MTTPPKKPLTVSSTDAFMSSLTLRPCAVLTMLLAQQHTLMVYLFTTEPLPTQPDWIEYTILTGHALPGSLSLYPLSGQITA